MTLVEISDKLHDRVQAFIAAPDASGESRNQLALDLARYQAKFNPGYARLVEQRRSRLESFEEIVAVPSAAFRLARIATHSEGDDVARFVTSGTTGSRRGMHALRRLDTYRLAALTWGKKALLVVGQEQAAVACLASPPSGLPSSSLAFMMKVFVDEFDRDRDPQDPAFLLSPAGIDLPRLKRTLDRAKSSGRPLLLLATSFSLVALLDRLDGQRLRGDGHVVVMQTGGFKGRSREVSADSLRLQVSLALGTPPEFIVGEYGMTELCSQMYEGCLPSGGLCREPGLYLAPPWLHVEAVDPVSLDPVGPGQTGLARFVDLANVDSAVCIITEDRIRCHDGGIELLGRSPGSEPRGCSLEVEALVATTER